MRKLGETVRINAQLISADTGAHLWAERFDEPIRDLAAGQDAIVGRIGSALGTQLMEPAAKHSPDVAQGKPVAYELVLCARTVLNETPTEARNTIAAGLFEQALRADPYSVPAMAGAALMLMQVHGNRFIKRAETLIEAAERVVPRSPDVLSAIFVLQRQTGRLDEAAATLQTLLDVDEVPPGLRRSSGPAAVGGCLTSRFRCWSAFWPEPTFSGKQRAVDRARPRANRGGAERRCDQPARGRFENGTNSRGRAFIRRAIGLGSRTAGVGAPVSRECLRLGGPSQ